MKPELKPCPTYVCLAAQSDGVLCADGECDRENGVRPVGAFVLPERDTSKPAEQQGLFRKFDVRRLDGSDQPGGKHHGCRYFVIDVDHDPHAKAALNAYATACQITHPGLARDLRENWGAEPVSAPSMRELIADDAYAATFQSVGQYRKALLAKYGQNTACCNNPSQCWEPCGELGNSLDHAAIAPKGVNSTHTLDDESDALTVAYMSGLADGKARGYTAEDMASAAADGFRKNEADATRYRFLRAMPPGIKILTQVAPGEWEEILSGEELDAYVREARAAAAGSPDWR